MIYLDNAATTAVSPGAADAADRALREYFGNPSSLYSKGLDSQKALERSRAAIAKSLGCEPQELYFTASGTEGNNLAILGAARARKSWGNRVIVSGFEHPSVMNTVMSLGKEGFEVIVVEPGTDGKLDTEKFLELTDKRTVLVTCMRVNNETGTVTDCAGLAEEVKKINRRTAFHCDAVQAFGKHETALNGAIDTLSVSAHKIHGPKGIGCLYVRKGFNLENVFFGGGQERGLRSGTENIAYAAGFAQAVSELGNLRKQRERVSGINSILREEIGATGAAVFNSPDDASPYILNFSLPGFRSETLLHFMEEHGVLVSSGSACGKGERSHTLTAMGLPDEIIDSAVRVSFSSSTTEEEVREAAELFRLAVNTLQRK
ncbi:MAG: cysteine desulfurase [Oscillospiraceae bacterium]|nr:cysteine desulfurase [Oscillospiraceae bacterium]